MAKENTGKIRIGIGGWAYEPWDKSFYPEKLSKKRQLEYASSKLTSIEINSTYYGPRSLRPLQNGTMKRRKALCFH